MLSGLGREGNAARAQKVAALGPTPLPAPPALVSPPRPVERSSRFVPSPSDADRAKMNELVTLASFDPAPKLVAPPSPAVRPSATPRPALASLAGPSLPLPNLFAKKPEPAARVAAIDPAAGIAPGVGPQSLTDAATSDWSEGWIAAPAWDEEHPEELSYRPFPLAPLLTASASPDDPVLTKLEHPDVARTLDMIDQEATILPMAFHPGQKAGELLWAQQFKGAAVNPMPAAAAVQSGIALGRRSVTTTPR
jgi:hypothetical protein